ncbi:U3 snoRNP protein [Tritrichomonas musculus]|uniref:U3 snoRNP protein n=1 Tax=Tritrichomonas musculus TaxID=1915356 RepID=A0ABR2JTB7_9EUKA
MEWHRDQVILSKYGNITCIAISPNNNFIAASTDNGVLLMFDPSNSNDIRSNQTHESAINQILWSKNGDYLISCSNDKKIHLIDPQTLKNIESFEGIDASITCCDITPSCELIAGADEIGRVYLWPTDSPEACTIESPHQDVITSIHFLSSIYILTSSIDGLIRVFSTEKLILLKTFSETFPISNACFSPVQKYITFSILDNRTFIVEKSSGKYVGEFKGYINMEYLLTPCFIDNRDLPNGTLEFIIPSEDGRIISYDFKDQKQLWEFKPHDKSFNWSISQNEELMASSEKDSNEIIIWKH